MRDVARLGDRFRHEPDTLVAASNRAAHVYRTGPLAPSARTLAERLDGEPSAEVVLFREEGATVARRDGAELRLHDAFGRIALEGDTAILDQPDAVARAAAALRCPNAGDVVVSAAAGLGVRRTSAAATTAAVARTARSSRATRSSPLLTRRPRMRPRLRASSTSRPRCSRTSGSQAPPYALRRAA